MVHENGWRERERESMREGENARERKYMRGDGGKEQDWEDRKREEVRERERNKKVRERVRK